MNDELTKIKSGIDDLEAEVIAFNNEIKRKKLEIEFLQETINNKSILIRLLKKKQFIEARIANGDVKLAEKERVRNFFEWSFVSLEKYTPEFSKDKLLIKKRNYTTCIARQCVIYVMYKHYSITTVDLGKNFLLDHSTIINAIQTISKMIETDDSKYIKTLKRVYEAFGIEYTENLLDL